MTVTRDEAVQHLKSLGLPNAVASTVGLTQEALSRGIEVSRNPKSRAITLTYNGKRHWWRGGNNSLNHRLGKRVSLYKNVTSALLRAQGINAVPSFLFAPDEAETAWVWAEKYPSVVLKPNSGQGGADVVVNVTEKDVFLEAFGRIGKKYAKGVIVEPYYVGDQYRCFVVNRTIVATALMRPASVVGDGNSSVSRLIRQKNRSRANHPSHLPIKVSAELKKFLKEQGMSLRTVPAENERVFLSGLSNLQQGGDSIDVTDAVPEKMSTAVLNAAAALPGMRIAGFDVMYGVEDQPSQTVILEVNTSPQLSIHQHPWEGRPRSVESAVLEALFPAIASAV